MSLRHLLPLLLAALAAAPNASAQYQWRDANGRMVFSDMPPPASVPPSAVQRAPARPTAATVPGGSGATASVPASAAAAAASPPAAAVPAQTTADRELAFRKRRLEQAEAERKAADAQARARQVAAACEDARSEIRTLESGMRVSRVDERGEHRAIDDTARATRLDAARRLVRDHCNT